MQSRNSSETGRTILVVDDEPVMISLLKRILAADGHTVHTAASGPEGIEKAGEVMPDLILMDILMPQMDGYEATARIKTMPGLHDTPIIFLSGKAAAEDGGRSFAVGGAAYLPKPFKDSQIRDVVRLVLRSVAETH